MKEEKVKNNDLRLQSKLCNYPMRFTFKQRLGVEHISMISTSYLDSKGFTKIKS